MDRLIKAGKIIPKKSSVIKNSRIGIGFEKLDRDLFDPTKAYKHVEKLGVKWARLQSGWQRTEREKGVYNFGWLDDIVDNMIAIGIEPWLCLCYGNDLYSEEAKKYFYAAGVPPIHTEEERTAWYNYVKATVSHFKGRIHYYEVWNEPDLGCWKHGANVTEYIEFTKQTSTACKEADPDCNVIGLALGLKYDYAADFMKSDVLQYIDGVSYHVYSVDEQVGKDRMNFFVEMRDKYKPELKIIQGESGAQSRNDGSGAFQRSAWNRTKQAKYILRRLISDLQGEVMLASYFSCVDMAEALDGKVGDVSSYLDFGYFGVLSAEFDENGKSVGEFTTKPSYYALQTLCSIFSEEYENCEVPVEGVVLESKYVRSYDYDFDNTSHYCFKRENGAKALVYWTPSHMLTETYEGTVSVRLKDEVAKEEIYLTDLLDGTVYKLSADMLGEENMLLHIPVKDSPMMLSFGKFCDWE